MSFSFRFEAIRERCATVGAAVSACALLPIALLPILIGCGNSSSTKTTTPASVPAINSYLALPTEIPRQASGNQPAGYTFTLDHTAMELDQENQSTKPQTPINRGTFSSSGGYLTAALNPYNGKVLTTPEAGNWLLERQGLMGFAYISAPASSGLDGVRSGPQGQGDTSQNLAPFVSNASCPDVSKQQTYQFLTFPGLGNLGGWNYVTDTAYGSVQIATLQSGEVVNLSDIQQFLLPSGTVTPGTPVTLNPGPSTISGSCGTSIAGNLISVTYPLPTTSPTVAYAEMNLAGGFLLEDNEGVAPFTASGASNILGAGYGAIGLLQPASPVDTGSLVGGSFQGFIYVPSSVGSFTSAAALGTSSSGCAAFQSSLRGLATQPSANAVYGGEYVGNDPTASANCDLAVDLGTQDSKNNGLYTGATIYIGPSFPLNSGGLGKAYSISAVAIAGQINGQDAVFVLAEDATSSNSHAIGIYLLHAQ